MTLLTCDIYKVLLRLDKLPARKNKHHIQKISFALRITLKIILITLYK